MKKKTLRRILSFTKPYRGFVLCNLLTAAVTVAAGLLIPIFCGNAIDAMIGAGKVELSLVTQAVVLVALVTVVSAVAQKLMALSGNRITYSVCRDLRNKVSAKMHKLPVSYADTHSVGDTVSRTVTDVDTFADGLLMGFTQLFSALLTIGAVLGVMLYLNPVIALAVVVLTPLSILVARFIATRTHRHFLAQATVRGEETGLANELIEGARVVKAFGHEDESLAAFDEVNGRLESASMKATFFSSLVNPSTRVVNNLVYAVVALICALYAGTGAITIGALSIFLSYASQYAKPFNEISSVITELQNAVSCATRVFEFLDAEEEVPDPTAPSSPEERGAVALKNVSFRYTPDRPLIEGLCLEVSQGQRVAIVGPTGCGKTTLINLLMRFYDVTGGEISVDGADIRKMTRKELRSRYGMVLQDTWLKAGTVRDNIAYGRPDATEEEIVAATKQAHAHSFIRRLPQGYDTKIVENGSNFSAGQRQLLCIARAMLALPPILILDEATSSIDTRTELKIQDAFATMMKGRTSFIVAHRLSTIKEADVILVMKDGKVIEQGTHETLLRANGFYATLYNSQFAVI
ncbi:MAG: ABC transporter ATP-binding protein [Ruminococcaceae bacterium]|nr:ABC transporter ATP-binding protein [Oscillospiraceae bacterium]